MKRLSKETRGELEHLSRDGTGAFPHEQRAILDALAVIDSQAAEIRDLKAKVRDREERMREAIDRMPSAWRDPVITSCLDLRVKNWRKP